MNIKNILFKNILFDKLEYVWCIFVKNLNTNQIQEILRNFIIDHW